MSFQLSPADIVLSCTICQETLSTIYAHGDRNDGLHKDSEAPNDGKITKLWLTECAHLTCGKHLPGGGAPFYSIHDVPRAPCPLCSVENDDHSDKALFFINGTSKGQYDENIPDAYFQIPPIQLSGGDSGLEALRFQYLSLLRFGTKTHEKLTGLVKALKRWEDKKPEIVRSLSSVAPLRDELLSAGRRLMALGEDFSSIETALQLAGVSLTEGLRPQQHVDARSQYHKKGLKLVGQISSPLDGGSRLARGSAADLDSLNQGAGTFKGHSDNPQQHSTRRDDSSSKRKRLDSSGDTEHLTEYAFDGGTFEKCRSRDQMPPPPIPIQQPFVYGARVLSSDLHALNPQHNQVNGTNFQRTPITPQRHPYEDGLSRLTLTPGSSMEPFNSSFTGARTNNEHFHADHHQTPPRARMDTAGPVYVRGGWQPAPGFSDTERSEHYSSPSLSLHSSAQQPVRRSMRYHQGSLMFPMELGDRMIDPSSGSYQSVSRGGSSSYHRRQSALAMQSQIELPAHPGSHNPSPNRGGRITLSRTPSCASQNFSNKRIGLSSHVRSSQQLAINTPEQQRIPASARFSTRQPAYSVSLPSLGGPNSEIFRRNNSFDPGPITVNAEMRPYSSNKSEYLLAQEFRVAQTRDRASLMESQPSGPRRRADR